MFKKIFITTMLVAVSSICLAVAPNSQKANNDNAVAVVKNEIASYKNLTKLQKAQMLVSHKSVEAETKIRSEAYLNRKSKDAKVATHVENKAKSVKAMPVNTKSDSLKKAVPALQKASKASVKATKSQVKETATSELSFKERLQAKFGLDLSKPTTNQYFKKGTKSSLAIKPKQTSETKVKPVKSIDKPVAKKADVKFAEISKIKELQKELQAAKAREEKLAKENNAMKTELKKSISVMQKIKQEKKL